MFFELPFHPALCRKVSSAFVRPVLLTCARRVFSTCSVETRCRQRHRTSYWGVAPQKSVQHQLSRHLSDAHSSQLISSLPSVFLKQPPSHLTTLPNGLRVATQQASTDLCNVGVFVDSGSFYETKQTNGVAHFLEHLIFKGTSKRSRVQLEKEVEMAGGHLNAYTARQLTVYYVKMFELNQALDILADILLSSKLAHNSVQQERHVILREMKEVGKSLEEVIFDRLHQLAFPDSSLGYTILGPPMNIRALQRSAIVDFIQQHYVANRIVVVGVGPINHDTFVNSVASYFKNVNSSRPKRELPRPEFNPGQFYQSVPHLPLTHCALTFEGCSWDDPLQPALMVLQHLLGTFDQTTQTVALSGTSRNSSLKHLESCLVQSYSAFSTCYNEVGLFGVYFTCPPYATTSIVKHTLIRLRHLASSVSQKELDTAKASLKTQLFSGMEIPSAMCEELGRQIITYGRRISPLEYFERIEAVTPQTIQELVWDRFSNKVAGLTCCEENLM